MVAAPLWLWYTEFDSGLAGERIMKSSSTSLLTSEARHCDLVITLAALIALDALLLWQSPAEQTLGQVVKLVYLHGALIRASLIGFVVAGLLGLLWLIVRKAGLLHWLVALLRATALVWIIYLLSSMVVTYLAWGVAIAWGEPRVMATIRVTLAVAIILIVTEIAKLPALTAIGSLLLGIVAIVVTQSVGVIRHPIDPIGTSSSIAIRLFYAGIVVTTVAILGVSAALFHRRFGSDK